MSRAEGQRVDSYAHDGHAYNATVGAPRHRVLQADISETDGCLPWMDLYSEYADFHCRNITQ